MPAITNRLAGETSPYLRQHAANPVAWQPWDAAALTLARESGRPILLSIGYSACHWCHVMAHESFEDEATAAVMNRLFVNIKVDREERPDLDQIYQSAHQLLAGRPGGWPLTVFMTPEGVPFYTGTYFPRASRYGLPGFIDVCERIDTFWRTRRDDIERQNRELLTALTRSPSVGSDGLDARPLEGLRELLLGSFDREFGGFGGAPKFPHPTDLAFLLRRPGDVPARHAALHTLRCMALGGIHDQLGGGFCRYSTDERWEIPHFEKMLYDNGQLLGLYAEAWAVSGETLFADAAAGIVDWLCREMTAPDGTFYAALDADAEGEEGKFYVWDRAELAAVLSEAELAWVGRHWGLDRAPNFEGCCWHLHATVPAAADEADLLAAVRAKLFAARERRIRPGCDDKVLASWNALAIEGLARAARILGRDDWLDLALQTLDTLKNRRWRDGKIWTTDRLPGYLDDHAFLLAAVLEVLQARYRAEDLAFASALADALLAHFEDGAQGGFFFTAHDHESLIQRSRIGHDNATPAGAAVAAFALQRLGHLLGELRYLEAARRTVALHMPAMTRHPGGFASMARVLEEALTPPAVVVLRGPAGDVATWARWLAHRADLLSLPLPNEVENLPSALAKPQPDAVNAWVCRGVNCMAPIGEFALLENILKPGEFR